MSFLQISRDIPEIGPGVVFAPGGFPITNSFLAAILVLFVFFAAGLAIRRARALLPRGFQNAVEAIYESMDTLVRQITGSPSSAPGIFPVVAALFLYIGAANLIGLIPGIGEATYRGVQIFRSPTTDFNTTLGLAAAMVLLVQYSSIRRFGLFGHLGKYFQVREVVGGFRSGTGEGLLAVVGFFIGLLDIVAEFARVVSLSLRLFGNMYAGVVLATVILGMLAFAVPSVWVGLGLFFGVVQAVVFGSLVAAYYGIAVGGEEA